MLLLREKAVHRNKLGKFDNIKLSFTVILTRYIGGIQQIMAFLTETLRF